jgi:type IV pilus assembly protein PilB
MAAKPNTGNTDLLRFLVRAQLVTHDVAQQAEGALAVQPNVSVIEWLTRQGAVTERAVAEALATGLRLPFVDLATVALDAAVTSLVKEELATQYQVVPLRVQDQSLIIATANPLDRGLLRAVEFATGKRLIPEVATLTAVRDALDHAYHLDEALNAILKGVSNDGEAPVAELLDEPAKDIRSLMRDTEMPPVVKLLNLILGEGIRARASDIHIEVAPSVVRVRYRIDGLLEEYLRLPKWVQDPLTARCKVLSRLDITERRVPQDGRISIRYRETMIDLRVSSLPTQHGEKITIRVPDPGGAPSGLDGFHLPERDLKCARHAMRRPEGMILVTGPTGSGKTTTLYGMIAEIAAPTRNIVTIENPIESQIPGINQVEINEKQGLTFAGALRSILRQDPDVVLLGEIRDAETAQTAVRAAQTGHLVLSTLHTNDAVSTITRLVSLGIEPYMIASSLHLVLAQRLVRRVCQSCAEPYEPPAESLRALQISGSGHVLQRGKGCANCRKTGYSGRVGVFEVLSVTPQMAKLIEAKALESALRLQACEDGTMLLAMHAAARVCAGVTTAEEALRAVDVGSEGTHCPQCDQPIDDSFVVCPRCAATLQRKCASCAMRLQKDWETCPYCGAPATRAAHRAATPAPPVATAAAATPAEPRCYRALIVDDHADMRRLVTLTLERSGLPIATTTASNGEEALEQIGEQAPDLIILDLMMPGMDGFQVCEQLRANVRTAFIPILMLTARDDTASRARGFLVGTDDYVGKPFARDELVARVRRLIERTYGTALPQPVPVSTPAAPGPAGHGPEAVLQ